MSQRRFGPLPLETMTPEQRAVMNAILAGPRSMPTGLNGPFEALLRSPGLAMPAQQLGAHVRFHSSIPSALNEMAVIMTARRWTAQYEWYVHHELAVQAGLDPVIADAIAVGSRLAMDGDTTAVYDFVAQLLDSGRVTDDAWSAVATRWGMVGAIDLIGVVGYYCLISFVLNVDRYPVPDGRGDPLRPLP